jgi:hypothetical protein
LCNGLNHFATVCKFKQQDVRGRNGQQSRGGQSSGQQSRSGPSSDRQKGSQHGGSQRDGQSGSLQIRTIDVSVDSVDLMFKSSRAVQCLINDQAVCLVCDTGAKVSIVNENIVKRLQLRVYTRCRFNS